MNKTALNSQKEKHSMLSLRRATFVGLAAHRLRNISIHALLAESDADNGDAGNGCDAISIHALLAESDYWLPVRHSRTEAFLSTLSLRRATAAEHRLLALNSISIHALLAESDLIHITQYSMCKISIHALLAESDILGNPCAGCPAISIHALLAESDGCRIEHDAAVAYDFYPRSPCGERHETDYTMYLEDNFYPRSPCGERQTSAAYSQKKYYFYPRSPCGERLASAWAMSETLVFLSTLSLRRATARARRSWLWYPHFYPRSPCGERRCLPRRPRQRCSNFYPRSPCGERLPEARELSSIKYFYPRSPCGERRQSLQAYNDFRYFYPRSPCGERHLSAVSRPHAAYFYPRSPCGERLERPVHPYIMLEFLSTLSLRRATVSQLFRTKAYREDFYPRSPCGERPPLADGAEPHAAFLSTLSLRRATRYIYICIKLCFNFYPRSPCGERPVHHRRRVLRYDISIHALLAESDAPKLRLRVPFLISIHALLAESDSTQKGSTPTAKTFLSTLSLRRATPPKKEKK